MLTMEEARRGRATDALAAVARDENMEVDELVALVAAGRAVILRNRLSSRRPVGLGPGLRTKVNANLGTSSDASSLSEELAKVDAAIAAGADAIMDLSTGGDLNEIRRAVLARSTVPVGSVPLYQAAVDARRRGDGMVHMTAEDMLGAVEDHARDGMDFVTVHCGVTREVAEHCRRAHRLADVVSRGGSFLMEWMSYNGRENPLYERYDDLLDIAAEYDVTLSLGDGLRPGSLADANDAPQIAELTVIAELVRRARERGVQSIVEGPGHVPLNLVESSVELEKSLCHDAPFYVLGPIVTDVAPGYDHVSAAIGGAVAAAAGADFLCYVTPAEHLRLPDVDDVREGVYAIRVAAHAADVAKNVPGARDWDDELSRARKGLKWDRVIELSLDRDKARAFRDASSPSDDELCTMCGEFCAIRKMTDVRKGEGE
uniref:Phosphomethylpyrimidine synthase n=1 Tax=uncultured Latescibacterota bacterium TaxID=199737 RepID=Q2Z0D3_9BACT|nr:thiamine biosynthesis protein [uncultured Latescibacterota bacterium]